MCWVICKGDNNRVMFLSSLQHRSQLFSGKHFFCGKEKLTTSELCSFFPTNYSCCCTFLLDLGDSIVTHVSSRCIGNRKQGLELEKKAIPCRHQRGGKTNRRRHPFLQPHSCATSLLTQVHPGRWKVESAGEKQLC